MKRAPGVMVPLFCLVMGCASQRSHEFSPMYEAGYAQRDEMEDSLFKSDTAVLSNEAIREILSKKITIPSKCSLAVVQLRRHRYYHQGAGNEAEYLKLISKGLAESPRIKRATQIPDILLPKKLSIPALREAAARLQCELVLIYRIHEDIRYRGHFFSRDTAKVYSSVEGVLLHTRTGIIPFTVIADQEHKAEETRKDREERGLQERTRHEATVKAMEKLNVELRGFLSRIETEKAE